VGLRAIQERSAREKTSLVVEGVHVVPGYMAHQYQHEVIQISLMLVLEDEALHRDRFALRERETRGSRNSMAYTQHFDQIRLIQQHLIELARGAGVPLIPAENLDRAIEKGLEVILNRLQEAYFDGVQV